MFRKNGIIAALVISALLIIFDIFFLDGLVKSIIIKSASKVAQAKVEISSLHVDVLKSKLTIKNLQVADKAHEFKNLFSTDEIVIDYMLLPLLQKKYIVDNISVINLSAGSDRQSSGFLTAVEVRKMNKEENDYKNSMTGKMQVAVTKQAEKEISKMPVSKISELKNIKNFDFKNIIKKEDLASYKAIQNVSAGIKVEKEKTEASIKAANPEQKIKSIKESVNKIKNVKVAGIADIPAAKEALLELDKIKSDADSVVKNGEKAKQDAEEFYNYSKQAYKEIDAAKQRDYNAVLEKADIKMLDASSIEKALIGQVWYERVTKIIYYMSLAEKYIPKKKKKDKDSIFVKKRGAGREIVYSSNGRYPGFWIKKVLLSVKGTDKGNSYYMKGEIRDIAAEQDITGKPLVMNLELDNPSQMISVKAVINHMEQINDSLDIAVKNLPASFIGLDKADFGAVKIEQAKIALEAIARNTGDEFTIKGSMNISAIKAVSTDKEDIAYLVIKGIDSLLIAFKVRQADNFSIDISSNAYDKIKKSLTSIYGSKLEKAKNDAKKAVEDAIKNESKNLLSTTDMANKSIGSSAADIKTQTDRIKSDIDKTKSELNSKITGATGRNLLKGLFK